MIKRLVDEKGFTIVEVLLVAFILSLVIAMLTGIVVAAQTSTQAAQEQGEMNEQIRLAMNQMAEDFGFGQWCTPCGADELTEQKVTLLAYQQNTTFVGWDAGWSEWPGYLRDARLLRVQYRFEGDQLIRTIFDSVNTSKIYSEQVLVRGLVPYTDPVGSRFDVSEASRRLIGVSLRTTPRGTGVSAVVETRGVWFAR